MLEPEQQLSLVDRDNGAVLEWQAGAVDQSAVVLEAVGAVSGDSADSWETKRGRRYSLGVSPSLRLCCPQSS